VVIGDESPLVKHKMFAKVLTVVVCLLMLSNVAPTWAVADQAQYIYDHLGWLSQVIAARYGFPLSSDG
jgi:hypothetical protein